jgi:hypothetical protein
VCATHLLLEALQSESLQHPSRHGPHAVSALAGCLTVAAGGTSPDASAADRILAADATVPLLLEATRMIAEVTVWGLDPADVLAAAAVTVAVGAEDERVSAAAAAAATVAATHVTTHAL